MGLNEFFATLTSLTCLGLGIVQASLASALGFDRFASQTCLGLGIIQASLASALGFDRFASRTCLGLGIIQASLASALSFDRFASQTCLGLGIVQASLASALSFDRLSLLFTARFRYRSSSFGTLSKATGFLLIARYASSFTLADISLFRHNQSKLCFCSQFSETFRSAICSKTNSKSQEINL